MKLSKSLLPVSELRHNANKVVNELKGTLVITQNGKAKAVLQDVETYEQTQEALALLKVMELGRRQVKAGKVKEMEAAFGELGRKIKVYKEKAESKDNDL
ncbi:type II toxin-antitoxin system Phd/YefM family antitoxin [candidate division KSB1 bacterium]|nr:type II toxin-antitoxin system Phd/YefM family antitoxin [candidate division KSB1 bacterium]NIV69015.1 type II toxin-antitoxin system prevent-host-death family antitoxin [Phycisphaerae bacterium]NIR69014.1 type II toxin-antitoxin system Phd/YefM family antitoxin [candidate division KSB1 bacterium]NIS24086.1 type II toxin-antitoxin system Phd/YefM family antitoxin [candidate division KSB1 bacterium]NIT71005.1 type II toxin-antitoxin system Phd/YefM family antitoxin [candidate division KSB1 ba